MIGFCFALHLLIKSLTVIYIAAEFAGQHAHPSLKALKNMTHKLKNNKIYSAILRFEKHCYVASVLASHHFLLQLPQKEHLLQVT
jgi:hypothetical protein